jgi:hypothetical protein
MAKRIEPIVDTVLKKAYYSHAKVVAHTPQEKSDIETLESAGFKVDNPYHPKYSEWWETEGIEFGKALVQSNDVFVFRALPDGSIPAGVAKELGWAEEAGKPIIELPYALSQRKTRTVAETVEYYKEVGK